MKNKEAQTSVKKLGFFAKLKKAFSKENVKYSVDKYRAFTALQAREVFSKENKSNELKDKILAIVAIVLKFVAVAAVSFAICLLIGLFGIIQPMSMYLLFVLFTTVMFVLQLLGSIASCTKNYYVAEDNKVLITFPSKGGSLFASKLTIEFLKQLKSTAEFYFPAAFSMILYTALMNPLSPFSIGSAFWLVLPTILFVAVIVLLGSLFSVLYLQYLRLVKRIPAIRFAVVSILFAGVIFLAVLLVSKIPADIDLLKTWNSIKANIDGFLNTFTKYAVPINWFCGIILGYKGPEYRGYRLTGLSFGYFFVLLGIVLVLFVIVFFAIKPLFLHMMTKSIDYEKVNEKASHHNHVHHRHTTFAFKELKISFRTFEISAVYIVTYVLIPVLIFLLCKIFDAINTSMKGNMLSIMFIVLLITLPLLASNTSLASAYSREGHAGYIKKTKPIKPLTPMISKLIFNLVLSVPSIFACMFIVGRFGKFDIGSVVLIGICVLLLQYAHIFYTSTLDFTHPKNENYQTEGQNAKNSNENLSTIVAFAMSFLFAFVVYFLFQEQVLNHSENFLTSSIRLLIVSCITFGSFLTLYLLKMKAYFLEK